jgi:hypothetical protein
MKENYTKNFEPSREIRKERFEFELTINGNIICQRYFKINNFNERSVYSTEFLDAIRGCASLIQESLRRKTEIYIRHMAPLIFNSETEMREWFSNESNINTFDVHYGAWIIIRGKGGHEYVWLGDDKFKDEGVRTEFNEFVDAPDDEQETVFKFCVYDNGYDYIKNPAKKVIGAIVWDGNQYPRFIRNGVDISNGRGRYDDMDISKLSHEMSLYYWCNAGQPDLVPIIIREICDVCSWDDKDAYTTKMEYGDALYNNQPDYPGPKPEYPYRKGELSKTTKK